MRITRIECKYSNGIFASCSLFSPFSFLFRFFSFFFLFFFIFFLPRWRQRARQQQQRRRLRLALFNNIYIYTLYYLCNSFSNAGEFHLARRGPLHCTWPINFAQIMYISTFSMISFMWAFFFLFYYKNSTSTRTHTHTYANEARIKHTRTHRGTHTQRDTKIRDTLNDEIPRTALTTLGSSSSSSAFKYITVCACVCVCLLACDCMCMSILLLLFVIISALRHLIRSLHVFTMHSFCTNWLLSQSHFF